MRRRPDRVRHAIAAALPMLALGVGCAGLGDGDAGTASPTGAATARATASPQLGYAMLATGEVVAVSLRTGRILARRDVGPSPSTRNSTPLLAWAPGRRGVYALSPPRAGDAQRVVLLHPGTLSVRTSLTLPADTMFTALAIGARTGTVYLVGTRAQVPVLATADAALTRAGAVRTLRPSNGLDWFIIGTTIDAAERRLVVSYHGQRTTGADIVDVGHALVTPVPCAPAPTAGLGCLHDVHGSTAFIGDSLIATTGARDLAVIDHDTGRSRKRVDSKLPKNHLMALASGPGRGTAIVAGSCMHSGGVSVVEIDSGNARRRGYPASPKGRGYVGVCGDSIATRRDTAIIGAPDPTGRGRLPSGLFILDLRAGGRTRFVRMTSPVAVLA